jgi:small-conductance mechanosensitive channel
MSTWLHKQRRKDFILNAEAQILSKLSKTLDEYGEYEEAELCQQELRDLHRQISVRYDFKTRPLLAPLIWPFRWYIVFVLKSTLNFLLSITVLVLAFWGAHHLEKNPYLLTQRPHANRSVASRPCKNEECMSTAHDTFYDTFKAIISGEPVDKSDTAISTRSISYVASLLGVLNLGILVSVLHSRMNRR